MPDSGTASPGLKNMHDIASRLVSRRSRGYTTQSGFRGVARTAGRSLRSHGRVTAGQNYVPVSNKIDARQSDEVDSIVARCFLLRREKVVIVAHERRGLQEYETRALAAAAALRKLHPALDG